MVTVPFLYRKLSILKARPLLDQDVQFRPAGNGTACSDYKYKNEKNNLHSSKLSQRLQAINARI